MKRIIDLVLAIFLIIIILIPFVFISIAILFSSRGGILHWSKRVGQNNVIFMMPKFRTMKVNAPDLATHLLEHPEKYITRIGKLLRATSIDELPQLYSVLLGHMSFVGPRPALFNQYDLIDFRTKKGVHKLLPGITGLAQISGRDELSIVQKVELDYQYLISRSLWKDFHLIFLTIFKVWRNEDIIH